MISVAFYALRNTLTQLGKFKDYLILRFFGGGKMRLRNRRKRFKQNWFKLFWLALTDGGIR